MKIKILSLILAALAILALGSCAKRDESIPEGYKLAGAAENGGEDKSEAKDYYLYVPQAWTVDINNTATSAFVSASDPASVSVMTWTVSVTDASPAECFDNSLTDFEMTYRDFNVESREDMKLDGVDALSVVFTGTLGATAADGTTADATDTADTADTTAAAETADVADTTAETVATSESAPAVADTAAQSAGTDESANKFRFRQILAVKDSLVYVLTYTNLDSRFDEHSQDFADIVSYFKFK